MAESSWPVLMRVWLDKLRVAQKSIGRLQKENERLRKQVESMKDAKKLTAPFSPAEIGQLHRYQTGNYFHPFTCPNGIHREGEVVLEVTRNGLRCPESSCTYVQLWAHSFMADAEWMDSVDQEREG